MPKRWHGALDLLNISSPGFPRVEMAYQTARQPYMSGCRRVLRPYGVEQPPRALPAARSQGWRSAGCSCARVPRDQPVISGTVDPLIRVVRYTKRHRGSMRMSRAVPVPGRRFQSQELSARSRSRKLDQLAIDAIDRGPHSLQQLGGVHLGYTMLDHASSPRRGRAAAAGWHLGSGAASAARRSAVRSCPELSELSDPAVRS